MVGGGNIVVVGTAEQLAETGNRGSKMSRESGKELFENWFLFGK